MAREKLSAFTTAPDATNMDFFVGVRDNGDGTFSNYKYTLAQIQTGGTARITVAESGDTITDSFFESNTISTLFTDRSVYISDIDFTQDGGSIRGIGISFYETQVIIASV